MSFLIRDLCDEYFETFMSFKQFEKWLYSINILYWNYEYRNLLILSFFFIQQITCVTDRARCFDLSGKFSNSLFIIFAIHPWTALLVFSKLNTTRKIPPALLFHTKTLIPSSVQVFQLIHISISTYLASLVWPAVNALLLDPKANRESFKFIDTTLGGDAHQPWQHNGRFKHAFLAIWCFVIFLQ